MPLVLDQASGASADSRSARLAQLAASRGDQTAVRYKARGLVHACSWRELAEQAAMDVPADAGHVLGLGWLLRALTSAHASADMPCLGESSDVVWLEPACAQQALVGWLAGGGVLAVGEALDTTDVDRRELGPSIVVAHGPWYDALADEVTSRAAEGTGLRAMLVRWALRTGADRSAQRALAKVLVLWPLADQLGLARTRLALALGPVAAPTRTLLAALDVPLRALAPEPQHQPLQARTPIPLVDSVEAHA